MSSEQSSWAFKICLDLYKLHSNISSLNSLHIKFDIWNFKNKCFQSTTLILFVLLFISIPLLRIIRLNTYTQLIVHQHSFINNHKIKYLYVILHDIHIIRRICFYDIRPSIKLDSKILNLFMVKHSSWILIFI